MDVNEIKEWREGCKAGELMTQSDAWQAIDTLLEEVERLQQPPRICEICKDEAVLRTDKYREQIITTTEALRPFAEASKEVTLMGSIKATDHWLWKPASTSRECAGVNAQMLFNAAAALKEVENE